MSGMFTPRPRADLLCGIPAPVVYDDSWAAVSPDGTFPFHRYSDGKVGRLRLFTPRYGTSTTIFSGDVASGASAGITAAATTALMSGLVHLVLADPQCGQSSPELAKAAGKLATTPEEVYRLLRGLHNAALARCRALSAWRFINDWGDPDRGLRFHDLHRTNWPILLFVLEEAAHACLDPQWGPRITRVLADTVKLAPYAGIAMWARVQDPSIEAFGRRDDSRNAFVHGNVVAYRNDRLSAGWLLPPGMPSPVEIPREIGWGDGPGTAGVAVVSSAAGVESSRPAFSRVVYLNDSQWIRRAATRMPPLDGITADAFAATDLDLAANV